MSNRHGGQVECAGRMPVNIRKHRFGGQDIAADIRAKYAFDGDLADTFAQNTGPVIHKWHHYIPIYDRFFKGLRGTPVKLLEIGVAKGGSLQMWRNYFGAEAVIFGIDIDQNCRQFDGQSGNVRIGSQDDPDFLASVIDEMGGVDVVLDDGSHQMAHVRASLMALFPRLSMPGIYMIEDLHTAYWPDWGGGPESELNFFRLVSEIIDDMHLWAHGADPRVPGLAGAVSGIHIFDSIAVLEKSESHMPVHSRVGTR